MFWGMGVEAHIAMRGLRPGARVNPGDLVRCAGWTVCPGRVGLVLCVLSPPERDGLLPIELAPDDDVYVLVDGVSLWFFDIELSMVSEIGSPPTPSAGG